VKRRTVRAGRATARKAIVSKQLEVRRKKPEPLDPRYVQQLKLYEEGMRHFQQQKFHKAKQAFQKVVEGFSRELADRAQVHLRICEQRIARAAANSGMKTPEDFYHAGIAMMNLGRWDEAREFLDKARKVGPKAEFVYYALAALDSLTGETDAALKNLKSAIELRPENRYHARNDEDFAQLLEDPRFTELLYPERDGGMS
jgi:tetratricopeptide (TPR) repeat protein